MITAANAGTSLSTVQNVQVRCQLTASCSWSKAGLKILTASAILGATVTVSPKERCELDSGSVIGPDMKVLTPTRDTFQCPGFFSKKFLRLRLNSLGKQTFLLTLLTRAFNGTVIDCISLMYYFGKVL